MMPSSHACALEQIPIRGNGAGRPVRFKPVGLVCRTGRRFDSIPRKGLVRLNNRRFLAPQAGAEIEEWWINKETAFF